MISSDSGEAGASHDFAFVEVVQPVFNGRYEVVIALEGSDFRPNFEVVSETWGGLGELETAAPGYFKCSALYLQTISRENSSVAEQPFLQYR